MSKMIENALNQAFEPTPGVFSRRMTATLRNLPPRRAPLHWRRLALAAAVPALAAVGIALAWQGGAPSVDRTNQSASLAASAVAAATMVPSAEATTLPSAAATGSADSATTAPGANAQATVMPYTAKLLAPGMPSDAEAIVMQLSKIKNNASMRLSNISLACQAIDGSVLAPGATLSLNTLIGEPSAAKGYRAGPSEDADGYATVGYDSGISQVATALYGAAACADLDIVERHAGPIPAAYVSMGQDAWINYDRGEDLIIRNPYQTPVQVSLSLQYDDTSRWQVVCTLWADVTPPKVILVTSQMQTIPAPTEVLYKTSAIVNRGEYEVREALEGRRVWTDKVYPTGINGVAARKSFTEDVYPAFPKTVLYNPDDPQPVLPEATDTAQHTAESGVRIGDTVHFSSDYLLEPTPESAGSEGVELHAIAGIDYIIKDVELPYAQVTSSQNSGWIPIWYIESDKGIKTLQTPVVRLIATDRVKLQLAPMGTAAFQDSLTLDKGQAVRVIRQWQDWYCVQFVLYDAMNAGERWIEKKETVAYSKTKCKEGFLRTNALCYQDDGVTTLVDYHPNYNPMHIVDAHDGYYVVNSAGGFRATIKRSDFLPNPFQR